MKLTPIFPPNIKPVRKGVYKVGHPDTMKPTAWAYWDGKKWGWCAPSKAKAYAWRYGPFSGGVQNKCWQGVLK